MRQEEKENLMDFQVHINHRVYNTDFQMHINHRVYKLGSFFFFQMNPEFVDLLCSGLHQLNEFQPFPKSREVALYFPCVQYKRE